MGTARTPRPGKLVVGLLAGTEEELANGRNALAGRFGPIDDITAPVPWTVSTYYRDELGDALLRQFASFERLVPLVSLPEIKEDTNRLEDARRQDGRRRINLDPGYLTLGKLVLASTKDSGQRVYLDRGVYAEVTLQFIHGSFTAAPHTYSDYAEPRARAFFNRVREVYRRQLRDP